MMTLNQPISIFCPMVSAKVTISSELLDDIGQFTKFIIWALGSGYMTDDIDNVIEIGDYVIKDEMNYLCEVGMMQHSDESYSLTRLGNEYFTLIKVIDEFNSLEIIAHINCHTGLLEPPREKIYSFDEANNLGHRLSSIIAKEFLQNKDYENAKEYVFSNLGEMFVNLNQKQIKSIYVELKNEWQEFYKHLILESVPDFNEDMQSEAVKDVQSILLKRTIYSFQYKVINNDLNYYRNAIDTLKILKNLDANLLSDKSFELINLKNEESSINAGIKPIYLDAVSGKLSNWALNNNVRERKAVIDLPILHGKTNLSDNVLLRELNINNENRAFAPMIEEEKIFHSTQLYPYSFLKEQID